MLVKYEIYIFFLVTCDKFESLFSDFFCTIGNKSTLNFKNTFGERRANFRETKLCNLRRSVFWCSTRFAVTVEIHPKEENCAVCDKLILNLTEKRETERKRKREMRFTARRSLINARRVLSGEYFAFRVFYYINILLCTYIDIIYLANSDVYDTNEKIIRWAGDIFLNCRHSRPLSIW